MEWKPQLLMTVSYLALSGFTVLLKSVFSGGGVSGPVFVFYEHLLSTFLLSFLALILEIRNRNTRLPFTFQLLCWAFCLGLLQIPLGQLLLTSSLRFVSATFHSIAMNTMTAVTFLLAVAFRRETFCFCSTNGQAKLCGIALSTVGATVMVLWYGPELRALSLRLSDIPADSNWVVGSLMVASSILSSASSNLQLEHVTMLYPAVMSLSALICFFGTLQVGVLACLTERSLSAWTISFNGSFELLAILYGGIVVTGFIFYAQTWCIYKKGPVFTTAFCPLLIVFSFILEALVLRKVAHLGSIVGAVFVIVGLYLLLWAKADDNKKVKLLEESTSCPLIVGSTNSIRETLA